MECIPNIKIGIRIDSMLQDFTNLIIIVASGPRPGVWSGAKAQAQRGFWSLGMVELLRGGHNRK